MRQSLCMCDSASCYYAANSSVVQAKLIESQVQARVATNYLHQLFNLHHLFNSLGTQEVIVTAQI